MIYSYVLSKEDSNYGWDICLVQQKCSEMYWSRGMKRRTMKILKTVLNWSYFIYLFSLVGTRSRWFMLSCRVLSELQWLHLHVSLIFKCVDKELSTRWMCWWGNDHYRLNKSDQKIRCFVFWADENASFEVSDSNYAAEHVLTKCQHFRVVFIRACETACIHCIYKCVSTLK